VGIFDSLESAEVDDLLAAATVRELGAGEIIRAAELVGVSVLLIEAGVALIRAGRRDSYRDVVVCHAGGDAVTLPPQGAEVLTALVPTRATLLTPALRDRLLQIPGAATILFDALAETMRQKHQTIEALAHHHHLDRVRAKLFQLAAVHGVVGRDGIKLDLPLTHELLAEMTGSARETVTRALDELQEEGLVVRRGRSYRLTIDPDDLPA
jgi:CRP/FNR family transcriptional regulator, cyclic AMP receptor protein